MTESDGEAVRTAILRGVARLPEAYGMPLRQYVLDETGQDLSYGELYSLLEDLMADGLVSWTYLPGGAERGYRRKRVFSLNG